MGFSFHALLSIFEVDFNKAHTKATQQESGLQWSHPIMPLFMDKTQQINYGFIKKL